MKSSKIMAIILVSSVTGFGLGYVVDNYFSRENAAWAQQRELQGCWASGLDRLYIRRADRKLQILEARIGSETWVGLNTNAEGNETIAKPKGGLSGILRLPPDADRLFSSDFDELPNAEWVRCEGVQQK